MAELPSQHRALVLESLTSGFELRTVPTPQPETGSAIVRVLEAGVLSYHREIYNGERKLSFPKPIVGGYGAVGRIAALGPDSVLLHVGKLVYVDCVIRGRDDPSAMFLTALHEGGSAGSKKLMHDVWRDGMWAEYAKAPLENCIPLDETVLCKELGYSVQQLMYIGYLLVPFGGLRDIRLEPGETVVVCPATGGFGGAGVLVAAALGARVIAMGRNETELMRLEEHGKKTGSDIKTVKISGEEDKDLAALQAFGTIDAVLDISPTGAANSTYLKSAITALRLNGRCSLMGFGNISASQWQLIGRNITLKGKLMYERDDILQFVKMLERGLFPKGKDFVNVKDFDMSDWKQALDTAAEYTGMGRQVMFSPNAGSQVA